MLSGCTIVHTLVPFRIQEVEKLCDTDFEFHFDFKVSLDIHPLNELPVAGFNFLFGLRLGKAM